MFWALPLSRQKLIAFSSIAAGLFAVSFLLAHPQAKKDAASIPNASCPKHFILVAQMVFAAPD